MNAVEVEKIRNLDRRFIEASAPHVNKTRTGEKVVVRLVKNFGFNCMGDVCGFPADIAKELVARGAATYHKPTPTHDAAIKQRDARAKPADK